MIKIIIFKQKDISLGFKIEGHALSREEIESTTGDAYDMICNSVSVLSQSAVIGMQEVLKLPVKYEINDGFLSLNLHNLNDEDIERGQILLLTFEKSLESLIMSLDASFGKNRRNKYIKIKVIDKYIKQNNSVFKISVCDNKIKIQRVEEDYDIELDINSITQLAFSYLNTDEIFMLNEIDESSLINTQKELLNALFEKRINYIDELV